MRGYWKHKGNYVLDPVDELSSTNEQLYGVVVSSPPPTWVDRDGTHYLLESFNDSDQGSTPRFTRFLNAFSKDRHLLAYLFHDLGWRKGGFIVWLPSDGSYSYKRMSRGECNALLQRMVRDGSGSWFAAPLIRGGVAVGNGWRTLLEVIR